jgi:uncharacterized protein
MSMPQRAFGKTGETFWILSFGGQRIVDSHGCTESEAVRIVNTAIDRGIRYFDTAWVYSAGQSEQRIGPVARTRRQQMWIATKVRVRDRDGARQQLEDSLRRLQTDQVDEWRFHNVGSMAELDQITGPGGALETALRAREQGYVRNISISGHTNPRVQIEALNRFPFDSVLCALSVLDHFVASFGEEFLPVANARGVATIGMKVLGLGKLGHIYERALRYSLGLPVSTVIVGMESMEQLERNLAVAESFQPLDDLERLELFREVLPMVTPQQVRWKSDSYGAPTKWARV